MHYLDHLLECPVGPSFKVVQLRRLFDWTNMAAALPQFLALPAMCRGQWIDVSVGSFMLRLLMLTSEV